MRKNAGSRGSVLQSRRLEQKVTRIRAMILLTTVAGGLSADPRPIGMAIAAGSFWADSAGVASHATLFESSTIETGETPVKLQIEGGVRILLDVNSRAQIYLNRLALERGKAQLDSGKD